MAEIRIGMGYDAHALADDVALVLGGVEFDHPRGLAGHSDGDVIAHALIDALLGAAGLGDIGGLFPSGEERFRGISSLTLLVGGLRSGEGRPAGGSSTPTACSSARSLGSLRIAVRCGDGWRRPSARAR